MFFYLSISFRQYREKLYFFCTLLNDYKSPFLAKIKVSSHSRLKAGLQICFHYILTCIIFIMGIREQNLPPYGRGGGQEHEQEQGRLRNHVVLVLLVPVMNVRSFHRIILANVQYITKSSELNRCCRFSVPFSTLVFSIIVVS